jgi:ketosteroid isomerase-like protein
VSVRSAAARVLVCLAAVGCNAASAEPATPTLGNTQLALQRLDGARLTWVSSECVDGTLDLAHDGFERTLHTELHGSTLSLVFDTVLAVPACRSTEVWSAAPAPGGEWTFTPEAVVALPSDAPCGARAERGRGVLRMTGDTLQDVRFASSWCRGYDARFTYRVVPERALEPQELLRRYAAHWNRRDAAAVAALFAQDGVLIEPFSATTDGAPKRHEGRAAVRDWLGRAFVSTPWLGLALDEVQAQESPAAYVVRFRYMDARLAKPVAGRTLFVVAGHEIYSAELQLLAEPVPLRAPGVSP